MVTVVNKQHQPKSEGLAYGDAEKWHKTRGYNRKCNLLVKNKCQLRLNELSQKIRNPDNCEKYAPTTRMIKIQLSNVFLQPIISAVLHKILHVTIDIYD